LNRVLVSKGRLSRNDLKEEQRLFQQIGNWLWSPLEIAESKKRILVIPEGKMSNLPWEAIIINGTPIVERHRIFLSPSLRHFMYASTIRVRSRNIEIFLGRKEGLRHFRSELTSFSRYTKGTVTSHDPCYRDSIPTHRSAYIWHYSGHAELRSDNPFYSSLSLADGPLFAADLRLKSNNVRLVTLAACRTGQQTYMAGEESTGFVRSLLEMGAKNVIASHWAISDKSTAFWTRAFYRYYFSGLKIDEALQKSTIAVRERFPSAYYWAGLSLFGGC
jgi:CHAT domain-containing protein